MENTIIRLEKKEDWRETENLIRESFWNVYRPGCSEHYVMHVLRDDPAFIPELDFVMEQDGRLIGQNMFMKTVINPDDGRDIPVLTMGPIGITPELKRQGYGKKLLDFCRLGSNNFTRNSLDDFVRHQTVTECWRKIGGVWKLVPNAYEENWSQEQCREIAEDVVQHISLDQTGFGAFDGGRIIGFATVSHRIFGAAARYVQLVCLQISEEYRRQGIGRRLFSMVCEEARRLGADRLYISAHSSKESQAAYRALGCSFAEEINEELAAAEPFDVQMEYRL